MLQCHICNKPFTSAPSHSRHVKYCMRTHSRPRARQKSCQACSASKVKCSFQRPSCTKCDKKGIVCEYEGEGVASSVFRSIMIEPRDTDRSDFDDPVTSLPDNPKGPAEPEPRQQLEPTSTGTIDWAAVDLFLQEDFSSIEATEVQFPAYTIPSFTVDSSDALDLWSASSIPNSTHSISQLFLNPSSSTTTLTHKPYHRPYQPHIPTSITRSPSAPEINTVLLTPQHPNLTTIPSAATRYSIISIIRGIRAYPLMMLQKETFPPLIHAPSLNLLDSSYSSYSSSHLPPITLTPGRIIARCMSISHLYALRTPETTPILWEAVLEQTDLFRDGIEMTETMLSREALLAAVQAQLIYVIMRVVAQATTPAGMNFAVMLVFKKLCERFVERFGDGLDGMMGMGMGEEEEEGRVSWEGWVVVESWRRMKCVYFLVGKIVNVDMGSHVQCTAKYTDVNNILLPCAKAQWEATSAEEWKAQSMRYVSTTTFSGGRGMSQPRRLESIGALVDAHKSALEMGISANVEALDRWNVEVDSLGALLNASLGTVC